jgi:uncharacterized protein
MKKKNIIFLVSMLCLTLLPSCFKFRDSNQKIEKKYKYLSEHLILKEEKVDQQKINYLLYHHKDTTLPLLVFIHGAPGSISNLAPFLELESFRNKFSILIIDRPGYGNSSYGKFRPFSEQAKILGKFIEGKRDSRDVYLVGHSFGATIVGLMAVKAKKYMKASIMLAPALDPDNEKYFWFGKLGKWKATRWMASGALKVAADEKYSHAAELDQVKNNWQDINIPVLHVHGDEDNVVPFINQKFSESTFPKDYYSKYIWKGMNHFFPFQKREETGAIILNYIDSLKVANHKNY